MWDLSDSFIVKLPPDVLIHSSSRSHETSSKFPKDVDKYRSAQKQVLQLLELCRTGNYTHFSFLILHLNKMDSTTTKGRDPHCDAHLHIDGAKNLNEMYGHEYESYDDFFKRGGSIGTTTAEGRDMPLYDPYVNEILQESYSVRKHSAVKGSKDADKYDLSPVIAYLQSTPLETQHTNFNKGASGDTEICP